MALDHTREFLTGSPFAPEDLAHTSGPLFFTRFLTHFCAPVFFLLAGTGGYLSLAQGRSFSQVATFFWTRGFWLVFLDFTIVAYAWTYTWPVWFSGVLWALGWSMIAMAFLVVLPLPWIAGLGTVIVVGHNLLDRVPAAAFGRLAGLWLILHGHGWFWVEPGKIAFFVLWPLIPWVGVMAVGYSIGALLLRSDWRKTVFTLGALLTLAFLILRFFHLYGNGDPSLQPWLAVGAGGWKLQPTLTLTVISFFDTLKYPPSLQFLLMTLGPALMALSWFDRINPNHQLARILRTFGRVPLFYYVLHLFVIHTLAVWIALLSRQPAAWLLYGGPMLHTPPPGYGHSLAVIYSVWFAGLICLYPACKWFARMKQQHPNQWWFRYL